MFNITNADVYNALITKEHSKYEEGVLIPIEPSEPVTGLSCKDILDNGNSIGSGSYILINNSNTFDVYCDMVTDGGGWTLIISDSLGQSSWDQLLETQSGNALQEDYRASSHTTSLDFKDILWYNHPTDEWTSFRHKNETLSTLVQVPGAEDAAYIYKAVSGVLKSSNSYYNLMSCKTWSGVASPIFMFSGSDEYGDDQGGDTYGKFCDNWENDLTSWYYRFSGGSYSGNPWKENGHSIGGISPKLQSFFIR